MNARDTIAAARLICRQHAPYLRTAILSLVMQPEEAFGAPAPGMLGTMGVTTDWICYYDPKAVEQWGAAETAAVLIHEVSHLLRDHHQRTLALGIDHELGNRAGDLEINDDIAATKMIKLPDGALYPSTYKLKDGLTLEEYARLIPPPPPGSGGLPGVQPGTSSQPGLAKGRCGGCAGNPVPGEPKPEHPQGRPQADVKRIQQDTAVAIRAHAASSQQNKMAGAVPAGWLRWAEGQLLPPKVRWEDKFPHMVRHAMNVTSGRCDYTYRKANRRQAGLGYGIGSPILAAMERPIPRIALAGDTSGSMGEQEMKQIVGTAAELLKTVAAGATLEWLACDSALHSVKTVNSWQDVATELKGGGGTDFRPVFEELERRKERKVDVLIFITDGCGQAPDRPPFSMKVIWLITAGGRRPASWGLSIFLDTKDTPAESE